MSLSFLNSTMRAAVMTGPYQVHLDQFPVPRIINTTGAVVRFTTSALCGPDLHRYHGYMGGEPPCALRHEASMNLLLGQEIPFADMALISVPLTAETTNTSIEQDYLTVSDVFSIGWIVVTRSGFEPGDTVAVFGAGPVGLLAAYSAILRGASRVYSVDHVPVRLEKAASIGAMPINFMDKVPVQQILAYEPGGVIRAVDAVGMEAITANGTMQQNIVLNQMVELVAAGGGFGQIVIYLAQPNTGLAPNAERITPEVSFSLTQFSSKGIRYEGGIADPETVAGELVNLNPRGIAKPGFVASASIDIEEFPAYYERLSNQQELKVFIKFPGIMNSMTD
ncbi:alcohol dehydrogenase GroES-like domain-containing protein [Colletotrichum abscissum]|uniref:Alcohol dehydrogenase GroES-like domain-containing protein n=1 Tax=Colletotrichum abscissum TaxID=1671311 RepID=A0A9P9XHF1_9PEZI|nr:alcohol dehydrogenase GroES-like domain-containing protein [Colletotrichum abscissum]KAI3553889.1 alcohol dehydrogenase GroES-like domain-containing protein [Colletotrichum abscissum]KAK1472196.1 alcohol dehydrogenase GroES-like domain-containing protein [Colletotrichum abscissum]